MTFSRALFTMVILFVWFWWSVVHTLVGKVIVMVSISVTSVSGSDMSMWLVTTLVIGAPQVRSAFRLFAMMFFS